MAQRLKKIKIGKKSIHAYLIPLQDKNLILLKGSRGYVMCGYLDLKAAAKVKDIAAKIVGVKTIPDALKANIHSCTPSARRLGIKKGTPVKEALKVIA